MQLEMTGLSQLVAKLENSRVQMAGPEMKKAFRKGGNVIKKAMQERAPVLDARTAGSTALDPGDLQAGMRVYLPEGEEVTALIGPSAKVEHVARWVEYGHRMVSGGYSKVLADGRTRGPGKAAEEDVEEHPFLRPAYEESIAEAEATISQSLKESYKEVLS